MDIKKLKQNAPVFILWTLVYWGYIHYFFSVNWNFHIFSVKDWRFFSQQWAQGWVVEGADQWTFILVAMAAIPVWYIVLKLLLPIPYRKIFEDLFFDSIYKRKMEQLHNTEKAAVKKRPSYRDVRPKELAHGLATPTEKEPPADMPPVHPQPAAAQSAPMAERKLSVPVPAPSDPFHLQDSLYSDEEHTENVAAPEAEPVVPFENMETEIQPLSEDLLKIMQANCEVFANVSVKGADVSFVAVGKDTVYLCQVDDVEGDWLADEDPFGSDAPLWFSDRSHRVSPVFELLKVQATVEGLLKKQHIEAACQSLLVKTQGVIINAEEMLSKWKSAGVIVCRSQSGGSAALASFTDSFPQETAPTQAFVKKVKDALHLTAKKAAAKGDSAKRTKKPKG